jgi:hypothetical protein
MRKSSRIALVSAVALTGVLAGYMLMPGARPPDRDQILVELESARAAGSEQSVSGVMKVISDNYKDSEGLSKQKLSALLAQAFRSSGKIDVVVAPPVIDVHGDDATVTTHVKVRDPDNATDLFDQDVVTRWQREESRRYFVIPDKTWRIVGASYKAPTLFD